MIRKFFPLRLGHAKERLGKSQATLAMPLSRVVDAVLDVMIFNVGVVEDDVQTAPDSPVLAGV